MYNLFETNQSNNNELYCVYMHINKINGKRYIGQTKRNPTSRFGRNGSNYHKCPYFYNAIKKYGWNNFEHIIIQDNLTREQANLLEEINIATYNTTNDSFGYNLKAGGDNGGKCSEETKRKISETQKGKHLSEEHKINISKARLGQRLTGKKVGQYTLDGKLVHIYNSVVETSCVGYNPKYIYKVCRGERNKYKDYIWKYI